MKSFHIFYNFFSFVVSSKGFMAGNNKTSWILIWSVNSMTVLSIPKINWKITQSPSCGGRKSVLQSINESLIVEHRFIISFFLLFNLLHKQFLLNEWVVQFSISVAEFVVVDEKFKSFSQTRFRSVILGQWWHWLWMFNDEGWVQTLRFEEASDQLVNQSGGCSWVATINMMLLALFIEELSCFFCFNIFRKWLAKLFFKFFHHRDSSPWWREIDFEFLLRFGWVWMELDFVATSQFLDHFWEHIFSQIKKVLVISISHIELATGVLGIMSLIDWLISEVLSDFEDSVQTTDDELL